MPIEHDEWAERCKCDKCVWQRVQKLIADGKRGREVEFAIILGNMLNPYRHEKRT